VPTFEGSIDFDVYLDLGSWPSDSVVSTVESYLLTEFATLTGVDASYLSLAFDYVAENRRRHLSAVDEQRILATTLWTLKITCTVTVPSSSYEQTASAYESSVSSLSTATFVSDLNNACGCSDYSAISIDSYGVEDINSDDKSSANLALLSILVLLIIPVTIAFYYIKITYYPVHKYEETSVDAANVAKGNVNSATDNIVIELQDK